MDPRYTATDKGMELNPGMLVKAPLQASVLHVEQCSSVEYGEDLIDAQGLLLLYACSQAQDRSICKSPLLTKKPTLSKNEFNLFVTKTFSHVYYLNEIIPVIFILFF